MKKNIYIPCSQFPWNVARSYSDISPISPLYRYYIGLWLMSDIPVISLKAEIVPYLFLNSTTGTSLMPVHSKNLKKLVQWNEWLYVTK